MANKRQTKAKTGRTIAQIVGGNIAERRKDFGWTQEVLAEKMGINQESLSRMEKGRIAPKLERLPVIAEILNCTVIDLFRTSGERMDERAETIVDIIRPLSDDDQKWVVDTMAQMIMRMRRKE